MVDISGDRTVSLSKERTSAYGCMLIWQWPRGKNLATPRIFVELQPYIDLYGLILNHSSNLHVSEHVATAQCIFSFRKYCLEVFQSLLRILGNYFLPPVENPLRLVFHDVVSCYMFVLQLYVNRLDGGYLQIHGLHETGIICVTK